LIPNFRLACSICRGNIIIEDDTACCENCGQKFEFVDGIWQFLPQSAAQYYERFLDQYRSRRRTEGWGSENADYYLTLPRVPHNDPQYRIWRIREKSLARLLNLIDNEPSRKILDIGAGNCWLSNRLAQSRHTLAALDLSIDRYDGLGARKNYATCFECYRAEFDHLPFVHGQFDFAIFNASLHYSSAIATTLAEARRVITQEGRLVVMDSPFYNDVASGEKFAREQPSSLNWESGMPGFLTMDRLAKAACEAGLEISVWSADTEWHKQLRRKLVERKLKRQPAYFPIVTLENK
jgi:SAM-dependent methyltransferase